MVNLPFSPTVAVRISAGYQHYAGFVDERYIVKLSPPSTAINSPVGIPASANPNNILGPLEFTPKNDANDSNQSHVRAALLFKPDADFSALLTYYHQNDVAYGIQAISPNFGGSVDTPPAQNPFYSPAYPVSFPTGGTVFPHNSTYDTNDSFLLQNKRHTDLVSADLRYDFGFASLSSDTSYYQDGGTDVQDNTGELTLYPSFYGFLPRMVDYQTDYDHTNGFVQEFRLVIEARRALRLCSGSLLRAAQVRFGPDAMDSRANLLRRPGRRSRSQCRDARRRQLDCEHADLFSRSRRLRRTHLASHRRVAGHRRRTAIQPGLLIEHQHCVPGSAASTAAATRSAPRPWTRATPRTITSSS